MGYNSERGKIGPISGSNKEVDFPKYRRTF